LKKNVLEPPEPKGKLDAETVNGPEDETLGWDAIVWPVHEENVRRLRQRMPNRAICVRLRAEPNGSTDAWIC